MRFKQYLVEQNDLWPMTREEVERELEKHGLDTNYVINDDLTVDIHGDVLLHWDNLHTINAAFKKKHHDDAETATHFPVKFGIVAGKFDCRWPNVTSLEGAPMYIGGDFIITGMKKIISLIDIAEIVPEIHGEFWCLWSQIKDGGIGLMNIKGLEQLGALGTGSSGPFQIIDRYIVGKEDNIFACQTELIEAGFEEYAIL